MRMSQLTTNSVIEALLRRGRSVPRWTKLAVIVGMLGIVAALPFIDSGSYFQLQIEIVMIYVMATVGLNVAYGYAGEFFLIQPAVIAISAYGTAVLTTEEHWNLWLALPVVLVLGTAGGISVGLPGLRVKGLYLGLISFFGLLVVSDLPLIWQGTLGGSDGLVGVPTVGSGGRPFFEATLIGLVVVALAVRNLMRSSWGLRMRALRDAPGALVSTGFGASTTRLTVYGVSSTIGALAGWYLVQANASVVPSMFSLNLILILFAGVIIGGPGTLMGPIIGAAILEGYTQFVGAFNTWNVVGLGMLLFVVIVVAPSGVRNLLIKWRPETIKPRYSHSQEHGGGNAGERKVSPSIAPLAGKSGGFKATMAANGSKYDGTVLNVRGVRKSFGGVEVLRGVDLSIAPGEIVGLLGTNGSGKTTLVNVVTGLIRADSARIEVGGRDVTRLSAARRAQVGVARTFQVPQLVGDLSVLENIELGAARRLRDPLFAAVTRSRGCRSRAAERRVIANHVCVELGLSEDVSGINAGLLSLGLRRIVEVGRAMASGAQVICLDEPAAGLEEDELPRLADALHRLARSGTGILLIEHHVGFIMTVADSMLLLSDGSVIERAESVSPDHLPVAIAEYVREVPL
jgi:branched-chain amino acid transport system permease protein